MQCKVRAIKDADSSVKVSRFKSLHQHLLDGVTSCRLFHKMGIKGPPSRELVESIY